MEKRVFRSKIVYWVSILFLMLILGSLLWYLFQFYNIKTELIRYYINISISVLAIISLFFLIKKELKSIFFINLLISIILFLALIRVFKDYHYLGFPNKYLKSELIMFLINLFFLFLVNYFKAKPNDIKGIEEIDEIGKQ